MATLSFKDFSQGKPVQVVGNESQAQQMEQESGQPSLMSKLGQRAKDFGKEALTLGTLGASTVDPNTPQADKTLAAVEGLTKAGVAPVKMLGAVGGAVGDVVGAGLQATGLDKPLGEALAPIAQSDMAQKAVQAFKALPQEYQELLTAGGEASNLIGLGVGKKAVTTGLEAGVKTIGKVGVPESVSGVVSKVTPTSEGIMQRVARIPKGEQAKFEQLAGESVGSYLDKRGIYGTPDKIVENLYNRFQQSKATADDALATIQGTYRADPIKTALTELEGKVKRTSSPGAPDPDLARVNELVAKEQTQGLTMSEINEVKRIYERRVRLDYLKSNVPEDVTRATNVDSALRTWQLAEAEKAGLTNLAEINKETQLSRRLMDALGKEQAGIGGNNALGLTDAILLAGGSPESIASLLVKKTLSDKGLQSFVAKKISKNKEKIGVPTANFKSSKPSIQQSEGKVLLPSTKSTPNAKEGKGIRGMLNFDEWIPKNEGKTLKKANGDSVVFTGKTEMIDGELKYELKDAEGSDYVSAKTLEKIADEQPTIDTTIAENKKSLDAYNKEKQTQLTREQNLKDKEAERKAQSMELGDFTENMTPMQKAKVAAILDKNIRLSTGEVITKREYIKRRIDGGYEVSDTGILREKGKDAGYALNKTEADYARFLSKKKVVSEPIMVYHGTSLENANKIKTEGFKTGTGKGVSGLPSNDFIYVTENKNSANKYVSDRLSIKNPTVVDASFDGKILDIQGKMADFEAFGKASEQLGIPLKNGHILDMPAIKKEMEKQGYSAIRFSDKYQNGTKAIAVIPEKLSQKTPKVPSLEQEAKKYKSAEDFVKAQGTPVYHGTGEKFDKFQLQNSKNLGPNAIYFTPDKSSANYYARGANPSVKEAYVNTKTLFDYESKQNLSKLVSELSTKTKDQIMGFETTDYVTMEKIMKDISNGDYSTIEKDAVQEAIKKLGFDGFYIRDYTGPKVFAVFKPELIKTKQELTDIWNKSH